jgi:diadenosine tetraphosphate (Ap4A) HIT family hydrolase
MNQHRPLSRQAQVLEGDEMSDFHTQLSNRCEFCLEFGDVGLSRFHKIYRGSPSTRVVVRQGDVVALPTLGQLFTGSFLVLPVQHFDTSADLPPSLRESLIGVIAAVEKRVHALAPTVLFEHGTRSSSDGGCGIHHAHVHVVPVPGDMSIERLVPNQSGSAVDLSTCLVGVGGAQTYAWARDSHHDFRFVRNPSQHHPVRESQYFRRLLATDFGLDKPWNWRSYTDREEALLEALALFLKPSVLIG